MEIVSLRSGSRGNAALVFTEKTKIFFRSFYISAVIAFCLFIGIYGTSKVYENMRLIGFGEYKKAVQLDGSVLRILDFELDISKI